MSVLAAAAKGSGWRAGMREDSARMKVAPTPPSAEVQALRDQVEMLQRALGTDFRPGRRLGLTAYEARALGMLMKRGYARREAMHDALYFDRAGDPPDIKVVDVWVLKLRRKLAPWGISIECVRGEGYRFTPEMLRKVRALTGAGDE